MAQPITQVLLRIDKALQDTITTDSGIKLYIDPEFHKEWNCSVTATIVDLPIKISQKEKSIADRLKVGDEVAVSYQVVADFCFQGDGHLFMLITEGNDYKREYANGKGEWVKVYALPKFRGISKIQWVGVYQDKNKEVVSGIQGTQSEVERWLSQFPIHRNDTYAFNNFFSHNGKDYWKCNLSQIFGKRIKGELSAVNDRIVCKPIDMNVPAHLIPNIQHHSKVKIRLQDRAKVVSSNKEGINSGDIISFNPNHVEKYQFWSKDYYLVNEKLVQGKWQEQ